MSDASADHGGSRAAADTRHRRVLTTIAVFKLGKAIVLVMACLGLFAAGRDPTAAARDAARLAAPLGSRAAAALSDGVAALTPGRLDLLGAGALLYAAVFSLEGIGLWLAKPWAELMTLVVTASLLPVEVYELARDVTATRVEVLALNAAVVSYLAWSRRARS